MRAPLPLIAFTLSLFFTVRTAAAAHVGVASVDITPDYPVRLTGFGFRRTESEGVTHRIHAKALAFSDAADKRNPAVLITVDNLAIPAYMTQEVARRLTEKAGLDPVRLAITATHTHTAPMLKNVAPTLFGLPIPDDHQQRIDRYTAELTDSLERVALAALSDLKPASIEFAIGSTDLAANRRTKGGPVDHDLPLLAIKSPEGALRALYLNYACHCVTLSDNKISGDWAGFAQESIQKNHPGAVALVSIGCGADANPTSGVTGNKADIAAAQGNQIAAEVSRLLKEKLTPITAPLATKLDTIELLFDTHPTRDEWQEKAKRNDATGHHARAQLAKLDRGEKLQTHLPYPIQTWTFGDQLAMVFLPGEVVVDYALRLKRDFDRSRLWINAYANDCPCYIPSERILKEGGYEGGGAMIYYDRPTRLATGVEQKIIDAVHKQLPDSFRAPKGTEGVAPRSPEASLRSIRTKPDLEVELVAAEPLVTSPVAIDWSADGKLWVCEMFDYPMGADQNWQPGGRVKVLEDTDHDGRYDKATIFLENLPFPTGLTAWGRGILICAAPDIRYAEDTDADGKADKIETLFTGFATDNYQARVNSLTLGLDNYIHGANGLLGGMISSPSKAHGATVGTAAALDIRNHDFRFRPLHGPIEPVTGLAQQGRLRDDFGRWFGCDNSTPLLYYPHEQRYLRRNPHVPLPPPIVRPPAKHEVSRIYPVSRTLHRFNDPDNANRFTSACGLALYRDTLLGDAYANNFFVCEPVHNLVHRMLVPDDETAVTQRRAPDEKKSEFLASTDNWFRPVQVRTGPDGALYVVDMYRFLIEHPRWIPAKRLSELDIRAGADKGRVYRIRPKDKPLRPIRDLAKLDGAQLAAALDTPNGTDRDRVHVELLVRQDSSAIVPLEKLATGATLPHVRVQALSALDGLKAPKPSLVERSVADRDPHVRKHALRLSEGTTLSPDALIALIDDPSALVRTQLAYTLGESPDAKAGEALARLAVANLDNAEMRTAVLSSATRHCAVILAAIARVSVDTPARADWLAPLVATAASSDDAALIAQALKTILPPSSTPTKNDFTTLTSLLNALRRNQLPIPETEIAPALAAARKAIARKAPSDDVRGAVTLLGATDLAGDDLGLVFSLRGSSELRPVVLAALSRQQSPEVAALVLKSWAHTSPAERSDFLTLLLSREEWSGALLDAMKDGLVKPNEIPLAEHQRLLRSPNSTIQARAAAVFATEITRANRDEVIARFRSVPSLTGNPAAGKELFAANCTACHALAGVGHDVAPSLAALRDKDVDYFLKNILDPNAVVEPRFITYDVTLKDRRLLSGIIKSETASALTLESGGGVTEAVPRADVKQIRASALSMMPEGFEDAFTPQQMADLIAFLKTNQAPSVQRPAAAGNADEVARDPAAVAKIILDAKQPNAAREAAVNANPQFAADLIVEMTRDLVPGTPAEYERIPWIWRVAVACGRRNDANQMKRVVAVSVPELDKPLHDWQAVVIGGGIINGISDRNLWPAPRIAEVLKGDEPLLKRYHRALDLASTMTDNEKVPTPTRYDALRMLGVEPWAKRGEQLTRYLAKGTHPELQQGAVSGIADVNDPAATIALIKAFPDLTPENRTLALTALLRDDARSTALLDALAANTIPAAALNESHRKKLLEHPNPTLRQRATELLKPGPN